jgi:fucose permease
MVSLRRAEKDLQHLRQSSSASRLLLYACFAATGVSVALPGALMPWLLAHWSLRDSRAGLLLFLFFLGNLGGALVSRGSMKASLVRGTVCTSVGAVWLPFASRDLAFAAILVYGLGLGILMTSISLLQSRRWSADCAAELTRLNLLWAIGACAAPWLILHQGVLDGAHATHVLLALAAFFAFVGCTVLAFETEPPARLAHNAGSSRFGLFAVPLSLLLLVFCATGVESSCGGWLAAYSQRSGHSLGVTIGAPTCFWAGLLASRVVHSSSRIGRASKRFLLTWNLLAMLAAVGAILLFPDGPIMLAGAFVVGFAAGPMYPLLLALVFVHDRSNMIFVLAGLGAASLPLLTGVLSSGAGSLRVGLLAPLTAAAAMALAGWTITRGSPAGSPVIDAEIPLP